MPAAGFHCQMSGKIVSIECLAPCPTSIPLYLRAMEEWWQICTVRGVGPSVPPASWDWGFRGVWWRGPASQILLSTQNRAHLLGLKPRTTRLCSFSQRHDVSCGLWGQLQLFVISGNCSQMNYSWYFITHIIWLKNKLEEARTIQCRKQDDSSWINDSLFTQLWLFSTLALTPEEKLARFKPCCISISLLWPDVADEMFMNTLIFQIRSSVKSDSVNCLQKIHISC